MTRDPIRLLDDPAVDQELKGFLQEERGPEALPPSVRQGVERRIAASIVALPGLIPTLGSPGGAGGGAGGASGAAGSGSAAAGTSSGVAGSGAAGATTSAAVVGGGGSAAVGGTGAVAGATGAAASATLGGFSGGVAAAKIAGVATLLVSVGVGTAYVAGELGQTEVSHAAPAQVDRKHEASQSTTGSAEATSFDAVAVERPRAPEQDIPSLSLDDLPDEPLQIEPATPAARGKGRSGEDARRAALTAEVSLLRRARSALQSDREAARRILQQYDAEFPSGVLRAEYAALRERAHQD